VRYLIINIRASLPKSVAHGRTRPSLSAHLVCTYVWRICLALSQAERPLEYKDTLHRIAINLHPQHSPTSTTITNSNIFTLLNHPTPSSKPRCTPSPSSLPLSASPPPPQPPSSPPVKLPQSPPSTATPAPAAPAPSATRPDLVTSTQDAMPSPTRARRA
jgi:hypothetical protein